MPIAATEAVAVLRRALAARSAGRWEEVVAAFGPAEDDHPVLEDVCLWLQALAEEATAKASGYELREGQVLDLVARAEAKAGKAVRLEEDGDLVARWPSRGVEHAFRRCPVAPSWYRHERRTFAPPARVVDPPPPPTTSKRPGGRLERSAPPPRKPDPILDPIRERLDAIRTEPERVAALPPPATSCAACGKPLEPGTATLVDPESRREWHARCRLEAIAAATRVGGAEDRAEKVASYARAACEGAAYKARHKGDSPACEACYRPIEAGAMARKHKGARFHARCAEEARASAIAAHLRRSGAWLEAWEGRSVAFLARVLADAVAGGRCPPEELGRPAAAPPAEPVAEVEEVEEDAPLVQPSAQLLELLGELPDDATAADWGDEDEEVAA